MTQKPIGIGMIGCGTVGSGVATLLRDQAELYEKRLGQRVTLRRVLVRDLAKAKEAGEVEPDLLTDDPDAFFNTDGLSIIVEVAGGLGDVGQHVRRALRAGRHVVTANKSLLAAEGVELFALARKHGVSIAFEASCAGGIPCVTALQFGLMANHIAGIYGILNGTCNYILTEMTREGKTYETALKEAQEAGFAEADPTLDVTGQDAAQKLAILAALAFGVRVPADRVTATGVDRLDLTDLRYGDELGYDIKLLGIAECDEQGAISAAVRPCFIAKDQPLAQVSGAFNALSVFGHAVGHTMYYGPGAGRFPTASAVVSDILNVASGWYPAAFDAMRLTPDLSQAGVFVSNDDVISRYYLRLTALDVPGVMAKVTGILGDKGISLSAVLQHEAKAGEHVPVVVTTHDARRGDLIEALTQIEALDEIAASPVMIRILELPE